MTLIELLVSIAIASILAGVTVFMLYSTMNAYFFGQNDVILQQKMSEVMESLCEGKFESYGVKDSLKLLSAGEHSVAFVPPWVEGPYDITSDRTYTLELPLEPGSPIPIVEAKKEGAKDYLPTPITFIYGDHKTEYKPDDKVILQDFLPVGSNIKIIYQPESTFEKAVMTFKFDPDSKKLIKNYKERIDDIPERVSDNFELTKCNFEYYDNTNTKINFNENGQIAPELLPMVTAIMVDISGMIYAKDKKEVLKKDLLNYCSIRNSSNIGTGIILRPETHFFVPNSRKVKALTLYNVMGLKDRGTIVLEFKPESGNIYEATISLAKDKSGQDKFTSFKIEYPPGSVVLSENINRDTELGINFMSLGNDERFDYDYDENKRNIVDLEGKVELRVVEMDGIDGAALFVKP